MPETPLLVFPEEETRNVTRNRPPPRLSQAGPPPWATSPHPPVSSSWGQQTTHPPASRGPGLPPKSTLPVIYLFLCIYFSYQFILFLKYTSKPQTDPAHQASYGQGRSEPHPTRGDPRKLANQNQTWNQ